MSADQWQAMCDRALLWMDPMLPDHDPNLEREEAFARATGPFAGLGICHLESCLAGLALFAHLMSVLDNEKPNKPEICDGER